MSSVECGPISALHYYYVTLQFLITTSQVVLMTVMVSWWKESGKKLRIICLSWKTVTQVVSAVDVL